MSFDIFVNTKDLYHKIARLTLECVLSLPMLSGFTRLLQSKVKEWISEFRDNTRWNETEYRY